MTVEHVPTPDVTVARASGVRAGNGKALTTEQGASIVCVAADVPPVSKDATQENVYCSGYNVWA